MTDTRSYAEALSTAQNADQDDTLISFCHSVERHEMARWKTHRSYTVPKVFQNLTKMKLSEPAKVDIEIGGKVCYSFDCGTKWLFLNIDLQEHKYFETKIIIFTKGDIRLDIEYAISPGFKSDERSDNRDALNIPVAYNTFLPINVK